MRRCSSRRSKIMLRDVTKGVVVAGASVLFLILLVGLAWAGENESATVTLDLDTAEGDQGMTTVEAAAGEEVTVEVYGAVTNLKSFTINIGFDAAKLSFVSGTVESGFQLLPPDLVGEGEVSAVGLRVAGPMSGTPLLLAKVIFKPLEDFKSATLTVTKADLTDDAGATDSPAVDAMAKITEAGIAVEADSWGKVKARFVR
jgi:hypothetical protein